MRSRLCWLVVYGGGLWGNVLVVKMKQGNMSETINHEPRNDLEEFIVRIHSDVCTETFTKPNHHLIWDQSNHF